MPRIDYNQKVVSDGDVNDVLQKIADYFQKDVKVTSGDRTYVPKGGSTTSLHLKNRAADFHVVGEEDSTVYANLKNLGHNQVFTPGNVYEFIWHGPYTGTGGQHLHIGRSTSAAEGKVKFKIEGTTSGTKNVYVTEEEKPIKKLSGHISGMIPAGF